MRMKAEKKGPRFENFNDGYVRIFKLKDTSEPGFEPSLKPVIHQRYPFEYKTIGVKRAYEAAQAMCRLDELIKIPLDRAVSTQCIACIDSVQYEIKQVQHKNETLPPTTWLSLTLLEECYDSL